MGFFTKLVSNLGGRGWTERVKILVKKLVRKVDFFLHG